MARPDISIQCFPVQGAAWRKENDNGHPWWSIKICKRQKQKEKDPVTGDWEEVLDDNGRAIYEDSVWYNADELLKVEAVARELHRQIAIEDRS